MSLEQKTQDAIGTLCFSNMKQAQQLEDAAARIVSLYEVIASKLPPEEFALKDQTFAGWYHATRKAG